MGDKERLTLEAVAIRCAAEFADGWLIPLQPNPHGLLSYSGLPENLMALGPPWTRRNRTPFSPTVKPYSVCASL